MARPGKDSKQATEAPRRRRWPRRLIVGAVALALLVGALPWIAGLRPVTRSILGVANGMFAGRIELDSASFSWTGPIRFAGLRLVDPEGKVVVDAPTASLDRGLWQLAFDRPRYGTLTLEGAKLDIERRADGGIDLLDVFRAAKESPPKPDDETGDSALAVGLKVVGGSLTLRTPELSAPIVAEKADLDLVAPAAPDPVKGSARLANGESQALELDLTFDHHAGAGFDVQIRGKDWPLEAAMAGVVAGGRLDGAVGVKQEGEALALTGDARVLGLDASGELLRGDRVRLDEVKAAWDVSQTGGAWQVSKLDVDSAIGNVEAQRSADGAAKLSGRIDLAALAKQAPRALHLIEGRSLEKGTMQVALSVSGAEGSQVLELDGSISDLLARDGEKVFALKDTAKVAGKVTRSQAGGKDRIVVDSLAIQAPFLDAKGSGSLDEKVTLQGTCDLGAIQQHLGPLVDFGALRLAGRAGVAGTYERKEGGYSAWVGTELRSLQVAGVLEAPIRRETARLDLRASGPASEDGLPAGWSKVQVDLKSPEESAQAVAESRAGGVVATAGRAKTRLPALGRTPQAEAEWQATWNPEDGSVEATNLMASLSDAGLVPVALRVSGKYDPKAGTLSAAPASPVPPSAVTLGAEGLKVTGLAGDAAVIGVQGTFLGDLNGLLAWTSGPAPAPASAPGKPASKPVAEPFHLVVDGGYAKEGDKLDLKQAAIHTRFGSFQASGSIDQVSAARLANLSGTAEPNPDYIRGLVAQTLEPAAQLAVKGRPFRVAGPLSGPNAAAIVRGLDAELGLDLTSAEIFGLKLESPTAIVARVSGGQATIDPIRTTINGGPVELTPLLPLDDPRGLILQLAPGSKMENIAVNDEVSSKLLSYVAPMLHRATQVNGRISLTTERFEFPLSLNEGQKAGLTLLGKLVFHDVVCTPGPSAREVLALAGQRQDISLKLKQPVELAVADGRVTQKGIKAELAPGVDLTFAGSVGFDQTLALRAEVPVTPAMVGRQQDAAKLLNGMKLTIPIGGTLSRPQLDRRATQVALRQISEELFKRGARAGADKLLDDVLRDKAPKDGAAGEAIQLLDDILGGGGRDRPKAEPRPRR